MSDFIIEDGVLTDYVGPDGPVVIPHGVREIGTSAFSCRETITSVTFPETVVAIGDEAFFDCTGLQELHIPGTVKHIGEDAFTHCAALRTVTIDEGVEQIRNSAFRHCSALCAITLPKTLTEMGRQIFYGCEKLADDKGFVIVDGCLYDYFGQDPQVVIPQGVTKLSALVFHRSKDIRSVIIPEGVTEIGEAAFEGCRRLTEIHLPQSLQTIKLFAFQNCSALRNVTIPGGVKKLGSHLFFHCDALESATLEEGVEILDDGVFKDCRKLHTVHLPESLKVVGEYCFSQCESLREVNISKTLQSIGACAFSGCKLLEKIHVPQDTAIGVNAFYACEKLADAQGLVMVNGHLHSYFGPGGDVTIPDTVKVIGGAVFYCNQKITSVTVPEQAVIQGKNTFGKCPKLADDKGFVVIRGRLYNYFGPGGDVVIPDAVQVIGEGAFQFDESITSITIPEGVTAIERRAFYRCQHMHSVIIPSSVTDIAEAAFQYCMELASVHIPGQVTELDRGVFEGCASLTTVVLPPCLTKISETCFEKEFSFAQPIARLVAPGVPMDMLRDLELEIPALVGFLCTPEAFGDCGFLAQYKMCARAQRAQLAEILIQNDWAEGLETCAKLRLITRANFETLFLQPALNAQAKQCIAFLLEWKKCRRWQDSHWKL